MIVYQSKKEGFIQDVLTNNIENIILEAFKTKLGKSTGPSEIASWRNSMMHMNMVLQDTEIPDDAGIAIEYQIPQTSNRIDLIITGRDENDDDHAVLIELKQWSEAVVSDKTDLIGTFLNGSIKEVPHPSYQVNSYALLLRDFSEVVYEENVRVIPCAYLHNYAKDDIITNERYKEILKKAPVFLKEDLKKLREFIKIYIKYGDSSDVMHRIEHGNFRPSRNLADRLSSMLKGNKEFVMIDEQKVAFETALLLARKSTEESKNVLIVEGGPGTGKSVVAINLLVELTSKRLNAKYVSKNAAPRDVFQSKLTGDFKKIEMSHMFSGSGSFTSVDSNVFDALIVDEAHRLNAKSGMFKNKGENQIKEIINASKFSVFFLDEDQKVTLSDIGTKEEIQNWADTLGASVYQIELDSQFRCNGSNGYLSWLDNVLQIRNTANTDFDEEEYNYEFKVMDSPNELRDLIFEKNKINNKARMVAGYCWDWVSKNNPNVSDVTIPEYDFGMRWNLASDGNFWILKPEAVNEIGCIHTCQGLEVEYIGVIVGPDLVVRNGKMITDATKRAKSDSSVRGYKTLIKQDPELAMRKGDAIIKNTYRTLMTRGMKGCYVFFTDPETQEYFKSLRAK